MFCPACGDIIGNVERLSIKGNRYRCPICGHVFIYITCQHLEKKYGPGNGRFYMEDYDQGVRDERRKM